MMDKTWTICGLNGAKALCLKDEDGRASSGADKTCSQLRIIPASRAEEGK